MPSIQFSTLVLGVALVLAATFANASGNGSHKGQHEAEEHSSHKSELNGMRALHAWTRTAHKGEDVLVFVELENRSNKTILFQGGKSKHAQSVDLVGFQLKDGEAIYSPLKQVPIKAGRILHLAPKALALRLNDLKQDLHQGETIKMGLSFDIGHMHVNVEIGHSDATQHSHAGHNHE